MYDKEYLDVLGEMEKTAYDNNPMAQYNMGWINARGLFTEDGLMQDKTTAKKWFEKSGKLGFNEAALMLKRGY